MERSIILLSGGLDSAVSLYLALDRGWEVHPLTFHFFLRPQREVLAAQRLSELTGCRDRLIEVDLPFLKELEDLRRERLQNPYLEGAPESYSPGRNLIFYSIAGHYAEVRGANWIVGGHNGADSETFPDATPAFFGTLNEILRIGLLTADKLTPTVINPLAGLTKAGVIAQGQRLGVPLEETWSCVRNLPRPCGVCDSCVERGKAFEEAGLEDPLLSTSKGL